MALYSIDYANKLVKRLQKLQADIFTNEASSSVYVCYSGESPIIPDYDFNETQKKLNTIVAHIIQIKHDIREANMKGHLKNYPEWTVDEAVLKLSFLINERNRLGRMVNTLPERVVSRGGSSQRTEIIRTNYDPKEVKAAYNKVSDEIIKLQDELNTFNILTQIRVADEVDELFKD